MRTVWGGLQMLSFVCWTLFSYLQAVSGPLRARGEEQPKRQM